jgi:hypothetical protein
LRVYACRKNSNQDRLRGLAHSSLSVTPSGVRI